MNPVLLDIGFPLATAAVAWLALSLFRVLRESRWRVAERRRMARLWGEHQEARKQEGFAASA